LLSLLLVCLLPTMAPRTSAPEDSLAALQRAFESPPDDSRIMMRWWWFGPSATRSELEREMLLMKEGGIGGFEVQPVYPLLLDDPTRGFRNYPFLSDEFLEALRFTNEKARELGLRMDVTLGSGWPFGGPSVPITQAASRIRIVVVPVDARSRRIPLPQVDIGETLLGAFLAPGEPKSFAADRAREILDIRDGAAWVPAALEGPHVVLYFLASRTGMQVKRPAIGSEGYVVDHYDRAAVDSYLKSVGDHLMQAFGTNPPYAVFCDSLEVYNSDWAPDFLEEFRRRRGYDLKPYLPALAGDVGEVTGAIRHDWGQTLTELVDERFLVPVTEWSHGKGTRHRAQVYGIPPANLSSNRLVDLAEGEGGPNWRRFSPTRWASSANHLFGRNITSSETWTWLHSPSFRATPLDMKAEADLHFLQGVNQLIGHGWPYSPEIAGEPGWRFYAAAVFNHHNPWWRVMPDVSRYLQRLSFLLRQGRPVNDVALFLPTEDAWAQFTPGRASIDQPMNNLLGPHVIPQILSAGFGFDFIDAGVIERLARTEEGTLIVGENRYRVVILPGAERIPLATLRKLDEFARRGGILIATRRLPSLAPGLSDRAEQTRQIQELVRGIFEGPTAPAHLVTDEEKQLGPVLRRLLKPDVSISPAAAEIGFIHRSLGFAEIFFLANTSSERHEVEASFRVDRLFPEMWDPFSGEAYPAPVHSRVNGTTTLALTLEPYESRVVIFSSRSPARQAAPRPARELPPALDLSQGWRVDFAHTQISVTMDRLRSWTDDESTRYFSGEAAYEKKVPVPENFLQPGIEVQLDFGAGAPVPRVEARAGMRAWLDAPVREAAVVYVNGQRAGSVWSAPFSVDVTKLLRAGENSLRVVVSNTAINAMAGTTLPDYRLLNLRYGERFQPQDMQNLRPVPSGLLGTVCLVPRQAQPTFPAP
jgi:hypothetical protein